MTDAGLLYSNARIKTMEKTLVSSLQMERLSDAKNMAEVAAMLTEFGYGAGTVAGDAASVDNALEAELAVATGFFKENIFKKSGLETLLLPHDYHNLKSLLKAKYAGVKDVSALLFTDGFVDVKILKEAVFGDEDAKGELPERMRAVIDTVEKEFSDKTPSGRFIDNAADRAAYEEIFCILKKCNSECLTKYYVVKVDLLNLKNLFRVKSAGLSFLSFEEGYLPGGKISKNYFEQIFELPSEEKAKKIAFDFSDYARAAEILLADDAAAFETYAANVGLKVFRDDRNDMFSVAPIAGFYLAKITELDSVRLIVSAVRNGVDKQQLKKRLRELYA